MRVEGGILLNFILVHESMKRLPYENHKLSITNHRLQTHHINFPIHWCSPWKIENPIPGSFKIESSLVLWSRIISELIYHVYAASFVFFCSKIWVQIFYNFNLVSQHRLNQWHMVIWIHLPFIFYLGNLHYDHDNGFI